MVWGDHSSILSTGFSFYTTKVLYDTEYFEKTGRHADVQSMVEQPQISIVANCKDSVAEKFSFSEIRRKDIASLNKPVEVDGVQSLDVMRFFQGRFNPYIFYLDNFSAVFYLEYTYIS